MKVQHLLFACLAPTVRASYADDPEGHIMQHPAFYEYHERSFNTEFVDFINYQSAWDADVDPNKISYGDKPRPDYWAHSPVDTRAVESYYWVDPNGDDIVASAGRDTLTIYSLTKHKVLRQIPRPVSNWQDIKGCGKDVYAVHDAHFNGGRPLDIKPGGWQNLTEADYLHYTGLMHVDLSTLEWNMVSPPEDTRHSHNIIVDCEANRLYKSSGWEAEAGAMSAFDITNRANPTFLGKFGSGERWVHDGIAHTMKSGPYKGKHIFVGAVTSTVGWDSTTIDAVNANSCKGWCAGWASQAGWEHVCGATGQCQSCDTCKEKYPFPEYTTLKNFDTWTTYVGPGSPLFEFDNQRDKSYLWIADVTDIDNVITISKTMGSYENYFHDVAVDFEYCEANDFVHCYAFMNDESGPGTYNAPRGMLVYDIRDFSKPVYLGVHGGNMNVGRSDSMHNINILPGTCYMAQANYGTGVDIFDLCVSPNNPPTIGRFSLTLNVWGVTLTHDRHGTPIGIATSTVASQYQTEFDMDLDVADATHLDLVTFSTELETSSRNGTDPRAPRDAWLAYEISQKVKIVIPTDGPSREDVRHDVQALFCDPLSREFCAVQDTGEHYQITETVYIEVIWWANWQGTKNRYVKHEAIAADYTLPQSVLTGTTLSAKLGVSVSEPEWEPVQAKLHGRIIDQGSKNSDDAAANEAAQRTMLDAPLSIAATFTRAPQLEDNVGSGGVYVFKLPKLAHNISTAPRIIGTIYDPIKLCRSQGIGRDSGVRDAAFQWMQCDDIKAKYHEKQCCTA